MQRAVAVAAVLLGVGLVVGGPSAFWRVMGGLALLGGAVLAQSPGSLGGLPPGETAAAGQSPRRAATIAGVILVLTALLFGIGILCAYIRALQVGLPGYLGG